MKKCPFCAEEIQDAAIKCRFCGSMLDQPTTLAAPAVPRDEVDDVRELAHQGKMTGVGLKEAKDFVDNPTGVPPAASDKSAPHKPVGRRRQWLALLAVAVGFLMTLSVTTVGVGVFVLWFGLAFVMSGPKLIRWFGGLVLAILLAAIGTAIGGRGPLSSAPVAIPVATSSSSSAPATAVTPSVPQEPTYELALTSSNGYESDGGYHIIEGQVKNISNQPLKNVTAVGIWSDKNGEFIKSDDALIDYNPILPGQSSPFKTMSTGNPAMARYRVEFKTLFGGTLAVEDQRKK